MLSEIPQISSAVVRNSPTSAYIIETNEREQESFIEKVVCNESDLDENEMKEVEISDDKKILLIRQNGKVSAFGANCPHYELPLLMGALGEGRIRCPWHGACFNIETGDIEDFPGLDSLPCFQVDINEGKVKVRAKESDLNKSKIVKPFPLNFPRSEEIFVIIGGGPSGHTCSETLRRKGFKGRIQMICKEQYLPYDRVMVSKFMDKTIDQIQLRSKDFYEVNQIEVFLCTTATSLNTELKEISLDSGAKLKYDKLFVATGSRSKKLDIPGNSLKNIFTVQDLDDAHAINTTLKLTSYVVIVGSGFIALESAAYCVGKVKKVTIIGRNSVPLMDSFGEAIGSRIMQLLKENNVDFVMNSGVQNFLAINQEEDLSAVRLIDGKILKADVCIVGIGSDLNTDFLNNSGITINENKSIDTNRYLETNIPDVYVGGDIANSPIYANNNECSTVGHYALAQYHGKVAALNMIGSRTELKAVPYFFTYLLGNAFSYTGHGKPSEIFIDGDLDSLRFTALYFDQNERVIAMSSCSPERKIPEFAEKIAHGQKIMKKDLWNLMGKSFIGFA